MQLHFSEQDVIDACAAYASRQTGRRAQDVQVDLFYEPDIGFGADIRVGWGKDMRLTEQQMINAVAEYLAEYHNFNPHELDTSIQFPDESRIEAYIVVRQRYR